MRIIGTITKVGELKEGVAKDSGNVWCNRNITVAWSEETKYSDGKVKTHEQSMLLTLKGDNARNFSLDVGTKVEALVSVSVNHFNERDYQNVYCSGIHVTA